MIKLLEKIFIHDNMTPEQKRSRSGMLCGLLGIALNLCLFAAKLTAGTLSGSIAITADAFNNLSDAGSSIISLLGFKLAEQKPDQAHPFGHGRIEYLSGFIVSVLIVVMGIELARDSIDAILHPQLPQFSVTVVVILALSVVVKLYMFLYNRSVGKADRQFRAHRDRDRLTQRRGCHISGPHIACCSIQLRTAHRRMVRRTCRRIYTLFRHTFCYRHDKPAPRAATGT